MREEGCWHVLEEWKKRYDAMSTEEKLLQADVAFENICRAYDEERVRADKAEGRVKKGESMRLVYVAGPFRATTAWEIAENIREAERVGLASAKVGVFPVIPHANTALFHGTLNDEFWLNGTLALMARCDAVITTLDWERSSGARAEVAWAKAHGMPVFHHVVDLMLWEENERERTDKSE